ncbi:DUF5994 family protein [Streptomyces sp. NPDC092296]|uniref:DUF5994 family protein n=1 Tax=Streptomyces sp. NPDC092296 TaxID=3366012 RepID=UPI0037FD0879
MSSTTVPRIASPPDVAAAPPRFTLEPAGSPPGRLAGAWWPRSREIARELPPLVAELDRRLGRITRVTVHRGMWPDMPRKMQVAGHTVHLGWFDSEQDRDEICLFSYQSGRWDLLVVPPETDPRTAERAMGAASAAGNSRTVHELLAGPAADDGQEPVRTWEAEGGAVPAEDGTEARADVARERRAHWPTVTDWS